MYLDHIIDITDCKKNTSFFSNDSEKHSQKHVNNTDLLLQPRFVQCYYILTNKINPYTLKDPKLFVFLPFSSQIISIIE